MKSMERPKECTTKNASADIHCVGTWEWRYSRKKLIIICTIGLFWIYVNKQNNWTPQWEQFYTPHKEITVDEVILSLSWTPSTSNFATFKSSSSARHSVVRLEQPGAHYCVGDALNVLVEMRNYASNPKAYGGDFILARIYSPKLHACASGDVTDFSNGTYRVRFRLFWPGEVQVSVRLIHSSEAVKILQRDWMQDYGKAMHIGTFISGGVEETSQCGLRLSSDRPLCEYRKKEDGEYYACYRPNTLPCNSLTFTKSSKPPDPQLSNEEAQLFVRKNIGIELKNQFKPVTVLGCTGPGTGVVSSGGTYRPTEKCVAGMNSPFPGGYFYLNRWWSSFCQTYPLLSEDAITRCLKGKTLYLLGDSTVRQWIEHLETKLKGLRFKYRRDNSQLAFDSHNNITVKWVKHYHPWVSYGAVNIKTSFTIPEVLDSIAVEGRQEDVGVVIGLGQHFRTYPPEVFIRRLQNIRLAILRLQARNPKANVAIKLENTRQLDSQVRQVTQFSNWYGYMQNQAQRKVFEDMKVALVDAWDMTVAADSFSIHPEALIVSNELAVALSFFCH